MAGDYYDTNSDGGDGYGSILSQILDTAGQLGSAAILANQQSALRARALPTGQMVGAPTQTHWTGYLLAAAAAIAAILVYQKL